MIKSEKKFHYFDSFLYLNILIFFKIIVLTNQCSFEAPFLYQSNCLNQDDCPYEYIENGICEIDNNLIKTQWLNNIITFNNDNNNGIKYYYVDICTTTDGNLVLLSSSSIEEYKGNRIFYIIKEDGRGYFINNENDESPFYLYETFLDFKTNGNIFSIKLNNNNNDKEYIISISPNNFFEIYDINNKIYYNNTFDKLFGIDSYQNISAYIGSENNYYLSFIGKSGFYNHFYINKLNFSSIEIDNSSPNIINKYYLSSNSKIVSCYKTELKYIVCFYQTENYIYRIIAFDQNLKFLNYENICEEMQEEAYFFKCVHYIGEAGAFGFYNRENGFFTFKFKLLNNDKQIINYYSEIDNIILSLENSDYKIEFNDIIKINDKKICFANLNTNGDYLYLIIIYDYLNGKIKKSYYKINLELYLLEFYKLSITLYNNFICLASSYSQIRSFDEDGLKESTSLIIFSYPNSRDFEVDITNNLKQNKKIEIDLNSKCEIDNNTFGLIPKEIKIINFPELFMLYSSQNYRKIKKGDTINTDENIILMLDKSLNISIPKVGKIIYSMIVTEPDYDIYNLYINKSESECVEDDENSNFIKNNYIGRHSYCNIRINESEIKNQCLDYYCKLCLKDDSKCVLCKNQTKYLENGDIKCHEEIITTIIETTQPETTIIETSQLGTTYYEKVKIETSMLETTIIETSISDITMTTNIENIETTLPKINIIETTIPEKTIITNSETTNIKIQSTEPNYIEKNSTHNNYIDKLNCTKDEIINNKCNKGGIISLDQINSIKKDLLEYNNNILIKTENMNIQISTQEEQKIDIPEISSIDLGECENILKAHYNIPKNELLIIFKIDFKTENFSSTYVQYEVYDPTRKNKLNLTLCKDVPITINVPITLDKSIDLIYDTFTESGYNIFNENDSFYQDICSTYTTINGTDMLLSDRKKDIFSISQNQSLCQIGCEFKLYNSTTKKAKCDCETKVIKDDEIANLNIKELFDKKEIANNFYNTLTNSNFRVLKCFKLIFSPKIKDNIGAILMISILIIFIILEFASFIILKKTIQNFLNKIIKNIFSEKSILNKKVIL